jgi:8-amino-7-oxononanoate synthase
MSEVKTRATEALMAGELESLRALSQFRALELPAGVNLCSNDYLGLAPDPRLKQAVLDAVSRTASMGSTGSRLLSGNSAEWEQAESTFAEFAGTEAALYFGSGYAANIGVLSSVLSPGDVVFSDALNHASLIDGMRLSGATRVIYPHRDLRFLENALRERAEASGSKVIVTESVFSTEGDIAPIEDLVRLANQYGAELVIDEAHATGVCGPQGRGIVVEYVCQQEILAVMHTCGKALASCGAFVCGSSQLKKYLVNGARTFIFSTAMPPYIAGQIQAAVALARDADAERAHLHRIAASLREELGARGFSCGASATHIVPLILGTNELALQVASELQSRGFAVKAIRPPTVPAGTARIRISLTSRITTDVIQSLVAAIDAACPPTARPLSVSAVHA